MKHTPLTRTLIATLTAEPDEWTVATLAEDLDVSTHAIRHALARADRLGYDLRLGLSEDARLLSEMDLSTFSVGRLARNLRWPRYRVDAALRELADTGCPIKMKRRRIAVAPRILALYEAYPGPHTLQWYATHCPATVRSVARCIRGLAARGEAPPIDPGDLRRTEDRTDRAVLAHVLRRQGATCKEIGATLGVCEATARNYVRRRPPTPLAAKIAMINGAR